MHLADCVSLLATPVHKGKVYFINGTLSHRLTVSALSRRISATRAMSWAAELILALEALHAAGVAYRGELGHFIECNPPGRNPR